MTVYDSKLTSFLGQGPAASQPTTLNLHPSVFGLYHSKDTGAVNLWDGTTWTPLGGGGGGTAGVSSFNTRTGVVTLSSKDVTDALTFTPYNATNPAGYQTAAQVTASLGPYALITSIPVGSSSSPLMDGTASAGSATTFSKGDHVHPTDTSRYAASNPSGYQTAAQVTTALLPYAPIKDAVFTGTTTLAGSPTVDLHASTKQYVDQAVVSVATAGITTLSYNYIANTAAADPGTGNIRFNTAQNYDATFLYIDSRTSDNTDWTNFIKAQVVGTKIAVQLKTDATKICRFLTTGPVVDNSGWLTIPINMAGAGGYQGMPFAGGNNVIVAFLSTANAQFLPLGGGTLTGDLFLPSTTPTVATQATTKKYVDDTAAIETYTLPTASTSVLGGVKVDGTTVTIASGVISAVAGGAGTVTKVSTTGTGISGGPITTAGTLSVQWNGGAVSSLGTGLSLTTGVLDAVVPVGSSTNPLMDGVAAPGSGTKFSKDDHVHPVDTSRYAATNPSGYQTAANVTTTLAPYALTSAVPVASSTNPVMDGTVAIGALTTYARADHVHASDTSRYAASNPSGFQTAAQVSASITAAAYTLPTASTSVLGGVKVDGTTVVIAGGVISAAGGGGGVPEAPTDGTIYGRGGSTPAWKGVLPLTGGTLTGAVSVKDGTTAETVTLSMTSGARLVTSDAVSFPGAPLFIETGKATGADNTGSTYLGTGNTKSGMSGDIQIYTGNSTTTGDTGAFYWYTGSATGGSSGEMYIETGGANGAGETSGDITFTTGAALGGATRGVIGFYAPSFAFNGIPFTPTQPYTVGIYVPGVLTTSQVLVTHQVGVAVTFPAAFGATAAGGSSRCGSLFNATASTVLTVRKCPAASDPTSSANFSSIGTLTFSAGGHAATLATSGGTAQAFAAGDFLQVTGPSTADTTLANVFITLIADR